MRIRSEEIGPASWISFCLVSDMPSVRDHRFILFITFFILLCYLGTIWTLFVVCQAAKLSRSLKKPQLSCHTSSRVLILIRDSDMLVLFARAISMIGSSHSTARNQKDGF